MCWLEFSDRQSSKEILSSLVSLSAALTRLLEISIGVQDVKSLPIPHKLQECHSFQDNIRYDHHQCQCDPSQQLDQYQPA